MQSYLEEDRHSSEYNWLINSKSPYLKQHQKNPVNWLEWSPEAFEKAKRENKPVFLSIGYSSCHWCHIMRKELFEDEEVAELLNKHFISIKVDREERPDIDSIYMSACKAMIGHGGWPLNVFLTSEQVPFYTGTYFPKESRYGRPGFKELIVKIFDHYHEFPDKVSLIGKQLIEAMKPKTKEGVVVLDEDILHDCFNQLKQSFDLVYGGFGDVPKFPIPHQIMFLLRYYKLSKEESAKNMAIKTLQSMANGGIYDHIGKGFSRYSVDEKWRVPHFEKMLYDNALLAMAYTEAYQVTKNNRFKKIAQEVLSYIQREMENTEGGFYSAENSDSEGVEGKFYIWNLNEVIDILGKDLGTLFCNAYDISKYGNFEGGSIPNLIDSDLMKLSEESSISYEELLLILEKAKQKLFEHRETRVHPFKDKKILTSWNGLMIAAFAKAGRVFKDNSYVSSGKNALSFIEKNLVVNSRLMVRFSEGEVKGNGYIDDYAFLAWGYIEMYESTLNLNYLQNAIDLTNQMLDLFWDYEEGGFFFYGNDSEKLLTRPKEAYDGAIPSGNSVAGMVLTRIGSLIGEQRYTEKANELFESFSKQIESNPAAYTFMLQILWHAVEKTKEVVIVTNSETGKHTELVEMLQKDFYPEVTYLVHDDDSTLKKIAPIVKNYAMIDNATTIYVCENHTCNQPTTSIETAKQLLE